MLQAGEVSTATPRAPLDGGDPSVASPVTVTTGGSVTTSVASVPVVPGTRVSSARSPVTEASLVSGAPTPVTVTPGVVRGVTMLQASVSANMDGKVINNSVIY